jgi:hypothetical protein
MTAADDRDCCGVEALTAVASALKMEVIFNPKRRLTFIGLHTVIFQNI